ncbi:hypothetical protein HC928_18580, partial [bacterium]|nr:hypothetical protein [bacterium]
DPAAWTIMRDTINLDQALVRFRSHEFPPAGLFTAEHECILTLIPLVDQSGQIGFMVFDHQAL